jgi:hypothetical protein
MVLLMSLQRRPSDSATAVAQENRPVALPLNTARTASYLSVSAAPSKNIQKSRGINPAASSTIIASIPDQVNLRSSAGMPEKNSQRPENPDNVKAKPASRPSAPVPAGRAAPEAGQPPPKPTSGINPRPPAASTHRSISGVNASPAAAPVNRPSSRAISGINSSPVAPIDKRPSQMVIHPYRPDANPPAVVRPDPRIASGINATVSAASSSRSKISTVTASRAQSGRRPSQDGWRCATCDAIVSREAVVDNSAQIVGGVVCCARCLRKKSAKIIKKRASRWLLIAGAVAFVAAVVFFPGQLAIFGFALSALALLDAICDFTMRPAGRLLIAAAAMCGFAFSLWGFRASVHSGDAGQTAQVLSKEAANIKELVERGDICLAQQRIAAFDAEMNRASVVSPGQRKIMEDMKAIADGWHKKNYGDAVSVEERALLLKLFIIYGSKTSGGGLRIKNIKIEGSKSDGHVVRFEYTADAKPEDSTTETAYSEGASVVAAVFSSLPNVKDVTMQLNRATGSDTEILDTFRVKERDLVPFREAQRIEQWRAFRVK